ncbi:MAG: caspase family protein [Acidobacteriota bacterium]|nr:caspase family protein [Acidobacteriota bacterium]
MKFISVFLLLLFLIPAHGQSPFPLKPAVRIDGRAPLALIIGVNQYKDPAVTDLRGAVADAHNMQALLTDPDGYAFPKENVILLTDENATLKNVRKAIKKGLIARAGQGDPVVIFFSGHGTQGPDLNGDEEDGKDEILLLHDSDTLALGLWDDEFNRLLHKLIKKTAEVTVILDACHSESGTRTTGGLVRAIKENTFTNRPNRKRQGSRKSSDGGRGMVSIDPTYQPAAMPNLVVISAAKDGTPAFDGLRGGLFTRHLIPAMGRMTHQALTWAGVEREVRSVLGHTRLQLPRFQGNLQRPVFGMTQRRNPVTWRVMETKTARKELRVDLIGTVMPGIGPGAELRVYRPDTVGRHWLDPGRAVATLEVLRVDGFRAAARVIGAPAETIRRDDRAVLVLPGDEAVQLTLRIRPAKKPGDEGVPETIGKELKQYLKEDHEASICLNRVEEDYPDAPDLEVVYRDNALVLVDRLGRDRGRFPISNTYAGWELVQTAVRHARIQTILAMHGDDHTMPDHQRLKIEIVPVGSKSAYGEFYGEKQKGDILFLPKKKDWFVRVTLHEASEEPMYVAGFALSGNGSIFPLPAKSSAILLKPGQSHTFNGPREALRFKPGGSADDRLAFFASVQRMDWKKLGGDVDQRGMARGPGAENGLFRRLNRFMTPGRRDLQNAGSEAGDTRYNRTVVTLKAQ